MQIREAVANDAEAVIQLLERLYAETSFLLLEPGEQVWNKDEYARRIAQARADRSGMMYVAEADGALTGVVFGIRGRARRNRHGLYLVIGVLRAHWNRGIGLSLLRAAEEWAKTNGLHRLELTVQVRNARAAALYRKAGFEVEGRKRHSVFIDNAPMDEWLLSRLIDRSRGGEDRVAQPEHSGSAHLGSEQR